jgi:hypothetical protein
MTVKRVGRRLLTVLVVLTFLAGAAYWALRNVGRWLVVDDPLKPARAIVVLNGLLPYCAMEAAQIYRQSWAPEVWLFPDDPTGAEEAFASLGIHYISEEEYDQLLEPPATNIENDFEFLRDELRRQSGDTVIFVTSPVQSRRVKVIWRSVVRGCPRRGRRNSRPDWGPSGPSGQTRERVNPRLRLPLSDVGKDQLLLERSNRKRGTLRTNTMAARMDRA